MTTRDPKRPSPSIAQWLADNADAVFEGPGEGEHLSDERLAALVDDGEPLGSEDIVHLSTCSECAAVVAELYAQAQVVPLRRRTTRRVALLAGAGVAIAAGAFLVPSGGELRSKGAGTSVDADVALLAVGPTGLRDLREGATLSVGDRIAFRYGNVRARYTHLTVLAWDGRTVRWYYPDSPDGAPFVIRGGPGARNVRMPFDIKLGEDYAPGTLTIVAAFDVAPSKLARALRRGEIEGVEHARRFTLHIADAQP